MKRNTNAIAKTLSCAVIRALKRMGWFPALAGMATWAGVALLSASVTLAQHSICDQNPTDPDQVYECNIQKDHVNDALSKYQEAIGEDESANTYHVTAVELMSGDQVCVSNNDPNTLVDMLSPKNMFALSRPMLALALSEYKTAVEIIAELMEVSDLFLEGYVALVESSAQRSEQTQFFVGSHDGKTHRSWRDIFVDAWLETLMKQTTGTIDAPLHFETMQNQLKTIDRLVWGREMNETERLAAVQQLKVPQDGSNAPSLTKLFGALALYRFGDEPNEDVFSKIAESYPNPPEGVGFEFTKNIRDAFSRVMKEEAALFSEYSALLSGTDLVDAWRTRVWRDLTFVPQILGHILKRFESHASIIQNERLKNLEGLVPLREVDRDEALISDMRLVVSDVARLVMPGQSFVWEVEFQPESHDVTYPIAFVEETPTHMIWTIDHKCQGIRVGLVRAQTGCACRFEVPKALVPTDQPTEWFEFKPPVFEFRLSRSKLGTGGVQLTTVTPKTVDEWYQLNVATTKLAFEDDPSGLSFQLGFYKYLYDQAVAAQARGEELDPMFFEPVIVAIPFEAGWLLDNMSVSATINYKDVPTDQFNALLESRPLDQVQAPQGLDRGDHPIKVTLFKMGFSHTTQLLTVPGDRLSEFMDNMGKLYTATATLAGASHHKQTIASHSLSSFEQWMLGQTPDDATPVVQENVSDLFFNVQGGADAALGVPDTVWWRFLEESR